jgi:hypothetical protein
MRAMAGCVAANMATGARYGRHGGGCGASRRRHASVLEHRVLTPASTHRARVIDASVLGLRRGHASTLDAAPAVLDPFAAVAFSHDAMVEEMGASSLTFAVRGSNAAAADALVEAVGERAAILRRSD